MEITKGSVSAFLVNNKLLPNASVVVSFKSQCNWFVLQKLMRGQPCSCLELAFASENTAIAYSIYEVIKEKLIGSPLEQSKSNVSSMTCDYQNGEFVMTMSCPNNITTIKKNMLLVASKIAPQKYYTKYSHNIKLLNGKPFKNEFLYSSDLLKDMKLNIFIIGKFNITDEKFGDIVNNTNAKFAKIPAQVGGEKPRSLGKSLGVTSYPMNTADGYKAVFVRDFIKSETGLPVVLNSGKVIVYNKKWNVTSNNISESVVNNHADQKYAKLKDRFIPVTLFMIAMECLLDIASMIKLYKDNPSSSVVAGYIKKSIMKVERI
jgi:hypothetical protein